LRHLAGDLEQPLAYHLARPVNIDAVGEYNRYHRETLDRARPNRSETDRSDQRIFDPLRNERFHLLGRQPGRLSLNGDLRRCELGKDSQTSMLSRVQTVEDNQAGDRNHDSTEAERELNDAA
jgi:hypothetical protein